MRVETICTSTKAVGAVSFCKTSCFPPYLNKDIVLCSTMHVTLRDVLLMRLDRACADPERLQMPPGSWEPIAATVRTSILPNGKDNLPCLEAAAFSLRKGREGDGSRPAEKTYPDTLFVWNSRISYAGPALPARIVLLQPYVYCAT
ncbi:hypothetical protein HRR83_006771 [Exophiala dermatitidis]|uniref:Uncharacterized protein n=1 Tax=Exophiala dermatitidis TaxID=5970 RepID=A0AAN6IXL1_EXODE|nr:hypothetical protein HRR74_005932 [Exophiala dermatitidis]KAJ4515244.1 hypothetical protein HRR73_005074 [Exophiala dermatitidis]KAJ4535352.1 hypothetical protein HRR77_007970 [Exophiala dermatitidis]KAJ4540767.1 hypothetical protein HRR76_004152 [Exophiala dermatitidis]KAJ4556971.1 hypothetical protein HRR79_008776 [Exophiala dermatitidis]